ncbi:MAG: YegS/Rv2252/BmrU family lipid kinase [Chloroflexia bacterium]
MAAGQAARRVRAALHLPSGRLPRPALVLLCGLPGTGKSHLARCLAERLPLVIVSSDQVRRLLFPHPAYTPEEHHIVHSTCLEVVAGLLEEGDSVIFDATNLLRRHRQRYYTLAEEKGAALLILQTTAAPEVVRRRLQEREEGRLPDDESEADWAVYLDYAGKMEPIRRPHRVVDTGGDLSAAVEEIARYLEGLPAPLPPHPRVRLILNPAAGQTYRLAELEEVLGYLVRQGWEVSLRETRRPGEAMELAREAAAAGLDVVVAVGGDGTVNEVVNGLAGTTTALAVLPMGTGNVWAREQGLPTEPLEAAQVLLQGQIRSMDLGLAGSRYFLLMAGVGYDAAVVQTMTGDTRQLFWPWSYILRGIASAIHYAGEEAVITLDDQQLSGETVVAVIGNTRLYGGFAQITPQATVDDGLLDICILRGRGGLPQISLFALLTLLQRQKWIGGVEYRRAREVVIASRTPLHVQVDGEPIGQTPMTFRAVPRALRVLLPRNIPPGLFGQAT